MQNKLSDWAKLNGPWAYEFFGRNKFFFFSTSALRKPSEGGLVSNQSDKTMQSGMQRSS